MAEVYRARREGPGGFEKVLALKRILPSYARDPQFVARFLEEARLSARLNHANIVGVVDFGTTDGEYYLVMEWVDGASLFAVLRELQAQGGRLAPEVAAHLVAEAAAGLHEAHTLADDAGRPLGLVHRDVSPQNVLVSRKGAVKVGDFGIAKAVGSSVRTATGVLIGKLCYMSPEQARNETLDARADVYALGIVLWECLAMRPLFPRGLDEGALRAVLEPRVRPPSEVSSAPRTLDAIVARALAPSRADRTPDAAALARDLRVWLHGVAPGFGASDLSAFLTRSGALQPRAPVAAGAPTVTFAPEQPTSPTVLARGPIAGSGAAEVPLVPQPAAVPTTRPHPPPARRGGWTGCVIAAIAIPLAGIVGLGTCAVWLMHAGVPTPRAEEPRPLARVETDPPGAWVVVDDTVRGTTPVEIDTPTGALRLGLLLRGYAPVLLRDGREALASGPIRLVPTTSEWALVDVDCPGGRSVLLGGQDLGEQPLLVVVELVGGRPRDLLRLENYHRAPVTVDLAPVVRPWEVTLLRGGSGCP
jgi:serine/threonine-protein kinase